MCPRRDLPFVLPGSGGGRGVKQVRLRNASLFTCLPFINSTGECLGKKNKVLIGLFHLEVSAFVCWCALEPLTLRHLSLLFIYLVIVH